jgi:hypothetical protein
MPLGSQLGLSPSLVADSCVPILQVHTWTWTPLEEDAWIPVSVV